ncbi:MAG: pyridoxamine 5'-phosphate oxidase [Streptosporangiaceae bacterium]
MDVRDRAAWREAGGEVGLDVAGLAADPLAQFSVWFREVAGCGLSEPEAMVLATACADGRPSARTVLLKDVDGRGFVFYTNYGSRKGRELTENPRASAVFPWHAVRRQVVVVGDVERLPRDDSERYFRSRPRGSQLGAWASHQSSVIASRDALERRYAAYERRWPDGEEIPLPDHWGGFRIIPVTVEFWHGRPNRLHDRLRYRREGDGWAVDRLSP